MTIMQYPEQCRLKRSIKQIIFNAVALFVEVATLKIMYNMVSSNINLTLKVTGSMILPLA